MFHSCCFRLTQIKNAVKFVYLYIDNGTRRSNLGYDYFLSNLATTWNTAELACRIMGMNLARIDDRREYNYAFQIFGQSTPWIGLNDRHQEGHFVGSDGCVQGFLTWANGQPDNNGDEDCVQLSTKLGMSDNQCTQRFRFLCKEE